MTNSPYVQGGAKSLRMSVDNLGFLLDRLGQDCSPLQFLRELNQNGEEAIRRINSKGQITWDVDWILYDLTDEMKLCIVDTGDGMTGEEMIKFINQLSSSTEVQTMSSNYGVGAKIAAATRNPKGVIYQSWKNGEGNMIHLEKDDDGEYGLKRWQLDDGTFEYFIPLEDSIKPKEIEDHGTKVILLGKEDGENTMLPPTDAASPSRWISKYLNTRYYKFSDGVDVKAREGWDNPREDKDRNVLRKITGQKHYLDSHADKSGQLDLETARVHWWILKDEPAISNNSGFIESAGHAAALYQNELYDRMTARAATALLQQFGILFGARYVVIYVEPFTETGTALTTDTARTSLRINGEKIPWADWAHEFRQMMPQALIDFVNSKAPSSGETDHIKSIKERLRGIMDLYKVSRYKPTPLGVYLSDDSSKVHLTLSESSGKKSKHSGGGQGVSVGADSVGTKEADVGNVYHLFQKKGGQPSSKIASDPFPAVVWVNKEEGSRDEGDMEDRAAKYLQDQNTLLINADFRVFTDMVDRLCKEKTTTQGVDLSKLVTDVVRQWFEQALVETVIGIQQLKGSREWGMDQIEQALSEEALTSAVMQRYHVHIACRRELGAKLGKSAAKEVEKGDQK